jgi:dTDP-4-dehydrorhamnose reductase
MSHILIIGASGQLGGALSDASRERGWKVSSPSREECDIENLESIKKTITSVTPDIVVNCAWFPVVLCESNEERANSINARGAGEIARVAELVGAITVQISTDYVFDGKKGNYSEADTPHPINAYGRSKTRGEELVRAATKRHYIIRTSALFGIHAKPLGNFVLKMKDRADRGLRTEVVNDQYTRPTYAEDIAGRIIDFIDREAPFGTFHVTNSGAEASWYDLAREVFLASGKPDLVFPSATQLHPGDILRPMRSILSTKKMEALGFPPLPDWHDAFSRYWEHIT